MKLNLFSVILAGTLLLTGMPLSVTNAKDLKTVNNINDYTMNLKLDTTHKTLSGTEKISYINNTRTKLNEIHFHVYANSTTFKSLKGSMNLNSLTINNKISNFSFESTDKSMIKLKLAKALNPNKRINIAFSYNINLPCFGNNDLGDRYGYCNGTYNLGNFFPIDAVYDENGWDIHPYTSKGDPFYSETSNFNVNITAPKDQILASTGVLSHVTAKGNNNIWKAKAISVRDFAFVSSNKFKITDKKINGITIKAYGFDINNSKKVAEIGADALKTFNKKYGKYPYKSLSIVQTNMSGGMEYPTLVMIGSADYSSFQNAKLLGKYYSSAIQHSEFIIVHEIAHQWWYGLVGNDEYREAWIDEPLAQYSTLDYFKSKYGMNTFNKVYKQFITLEYNNYAADKSKNLSLRRDLSKFDSSYIVPIYHKGPMMFNALRSKLGDKKFNLFLEKLFNKYKFKVVKGNQLIKLASETAGKDMTQFFHQWLDTNYAN